MSALIKYLTDLARSHIFGDRKGDVMKRYRGIPAMIMLMIGVGCLYGWYCLIYIPPPSKDFEEAWLQQHLRCKTGLTVEEVILRMEGDLRNCDD